MTWFPTVDESRHISSSLIFSLLFRLSFFCGRTTITNSIWYYYDDEFWQQIHKKTYFWRNIIFWGNLISMQYRLCSVLEVVLLKLNSTVLFHFFFITKLRNFWNEIFFHNFLLINNLFNGILFGLCDICMICSFWQKRCGCCMTSFYIKK